LKEREVMKKIDVVIYVSMLMNVDVEIIGVVVNNIMDLIKDDVNKKYNDKNVKIKVDDKDGLCYELWVDKILVGWYESEMYKRVR